MSANRKQQLDSIVSKFSDVFAGREHMAPDKPQGQTIRGLGDDWVIDAATKEIRITYQSVFPYETFNATDFSNFDDRNVSVYWVHNNPPKKKKRFKPKRKRGDNSGEPWRQGGKSKKARRSL